MSELELTKLSPRQLRLSQLNPASNPPPFVPTAKQNEFSRRAEGDLSKPKDTPSSPTEIKNAAFAPVLFLVPFAQGTLEEERSAIESVMMFAMGVWIIPRAWDQERAANPSLDVKLYSGPFVASNVNHPSTYYRGPFRVFPVRFSSRGDPDLTLTDLENQIAQGAIESLMKAEGISYEAARKKILGVSVCPFFMRSRGSHQAKLLSRNSTKP